MTTTKPWFKKKRYIIPAILLGLIVISAATADKRPMGTTSSTATTSSTPAPQAFNLDTFYTGVNNGMSKADVIALAGREPSGCSQSTIDGYGTMDDCNWYSGAHFVSVSLTNDKVTSKSKY